MRLGIRFIEVALSAALCGGALLGTTVAAEELRYATGYPPGSLPAEAAQDYARAVEKYSDGEVSVKVYPLSLLDAAETSAGVRDGIADIGYLLTVYFPAQYPHTNLVNEASMQLQLLDQTKVSNGKGALAYEGAMAEFTFFHCPECNAEYAAQNQVYTGNAASSSYGLLCNTPVESAADLEGKRLRVAGSHWSRWSDEFGATSLSLTINEIVQALDQGVLDCTISSAPELINLGLIGAVTDITMDVPGGVYAGASGASVNAEVWRGLTEAQRRAMLHAGAQMTAQIPYSYVQLEQEALERAQDDGATLHEADPALVEATREFVRQDLETIVAYYAENHGVGRGAEMLSTFRSVLEKWVDLVQGIESEQALAELYWDEIFSKVDVSQHGL